MLRHAKAADSEKDIQLGHFNVYDAKNNGKNWLNKRSTGIFLALLATFAFLVITNVVAGTAAIAKRASISEYFAIRAINRELTLRAEQRAIEALTDENIAEQEALIRRQDSIYRQIVDELAVARKEAIG